MPVVKAQIKGFSELKANIRLFTQELRNKGRRAIRQRWQEVLEESIELCPMDKGDLRESAELVVSPNGYSVTIIYKSHYAIPVHEHLSMHSPPSWWAAELSGRGIHWTTPGTGPKFLERPVMNAVGRLPTQLQEDLHVENIL